MYAVCIGNAALHSFICFCKKTCCPCWLCVRLFVGNVVHLVLFLFLHARGVLFINVYIHICWISIYFTYTGHAFHLVLDLFFVRTKIMRLPFC
jgi:hypothetical protein